MSSAHEFNDYADEHFGWAETAKTGRERAIFMQMAAAWLEVAQQWEAAKGARYVHSPLGHSVKAKSGWVIADTGASASFVLATAAPRHQCVAICSANHMSWSNRESASDRQSFC